MKTNDPHLTKTPINSDAVEKDNVNHTAKHDDNRQDDIESATSTGKGTDTFKQGVVDTPHVNKGDNPARQPDRRDQEGNNAFDDGINENTTAHAAPSEPQSDEINDLNRYANIDNAQTRVLNNTQQQDD